MIGERQGLGQSLGVFHGCFWVVPRPVLDRVGLLDERFARAYWEDDDFVARVRLAGFAIRQLDSVRVRHVGGLTTVKVPEHREWLGPLWDLLDRSTEAVLRQSAGPLSS